MPTVDISVTLPDDLAEKARDKGLLSSSSITKLIIDELADHPGLAEIEYPANFDFRLKGSVNPKAFRRGQIVGDIIEPIDIDWESVK